MMRVACPAAMMGRVNFREMVLPLIDDIDPTLCSVSSGCPLFG